MCGADQDIDESSLKLLTDGDLKELGFSMGHRRKICAWLLPNTTRQPVVAPVVDQVPSTSGDHLQENATGTKASSRTGLFKVLEPILTICLYCLAFGPIK